MFQNNNNKSPQAITEMIKGIYIFNTEYELLIRKTYADIINIGDIVAKLKTHEDCNFISLKNDVLVYRQVEDSLFCLLANNENEMYLLALTSIFIDTIERMLGNVSYRSLVYHFKDIYMVIDQFILNGTVINLNAGEILSSIDPVRREYANS